MAALGVARAALLVHPRCQPELRLERLTYIDSLLRRSIQNASFATGHPTPVEQSFLDIPLRPPSTEQSDKLRHLNERRLTPTPPSRARRQIESVGAGVPNQLIADVVTGKLDVRAAAAQLPDEADDQDPIEESGPLADGLDEALYDIDESVEELAIESEVTA